MDGRGICAVFFAVFQTADTPPDRQFYAVFHPYFTPVRSTAASAYHQLRQRVFSLLRFSFVADFTLTRTPCKFLLNPIERVSINYRIMMVRHQMRWYSAVSGKLFVKIACTLEWNDCLQMRRTLCRNRPLHNGKVRNSKPCNISVAPG